jgi:uncharacterized protein with LGFP repeats
MLARLVTVAAVVVTTAVAPVLTTSGGTTPSGTAQAADLRYFDPGNIISDGLFYDGLSMNGGAVQGFLDAKGANCVAGEMPCLKNYRQDTANQASDTLCRGYAGRPQESAADVIAKVGASCGINPRVLLVLLQKEQGLVTGSRPSLRAYTKATGFACPDTAPCNPAFQGFVSQVYFAARQFQRYRVESWPPYKAHRVNTILWHPNRACGSSEVYLANFATAALYNYTPYRPNQAALDAGYRTGDACSSYGNRNFFQYYTDWFGSTQSPGGTAILTRAAAPGTASILGAVTSAVVCGIPGDGCFRNHQRGAIYWSPATGAHVVHGAIGGLWGGMGFERGSLGYPLGSQACGLPDGGCYQTFQGGAIYWTPDLGAVAVRGAIAKKWAAQQWEHGPLGYPTRNEVCGLVGGGCFQVYEGGSVYWSKATGARIVSGKVLAKWAATRWETGPLGYPTGDTTCGLRDTGCFQTFQKGAVYSSTTTGAHSVAGAVLTRWAAQQWERGPLGYPTSDTKCGLRDGGCFSTFQDGAVYSSPATGARIVTGEVRTKWAAQQWERGPLGYPTGDTVCGLPGGGCSGTFQGGSVYWSVGTGARTVATAIDKRFIAQGAASGALGYPTGDQVCGLASGGCFQQFQHGSIYTSPATGARVVSGTVLAAWAAQTWERGPLGYPTGEQVCGLRDSGCYQHFQGGSIYRSTATGARSVVGEARTTWAGQGWERGPLGYPTADMTCGLADGGCSQQFQGGVLYSSPATGTRYLTGQIRAAWQATGAEGGSLGYPTSNPTCTLVRGGCFQRFEHGSIYWTADTGAHAVTGAIRTAWGTAGWERGTLGYPKQAAVTTPSEITQQFEGGTLVLNRSTGAVTRR